MVIILRKRKRDTEIWRLLFAVNVRLDPFMLQKSRRLPVQANHSMIIET